MLASGSNGTSICAEVSVVIISNGHALHFDISVYASLTLQGSQEACIYDVASDKTQDKIMGTNRQRKMDKTPHYLSQNEKGGQKWTSSTCS